MDMSAALTIGTTVSNFYAEEFRCLMRTLEEDLILPYGCIKKYRPDNYEGRRQSFQKTGDRVGYGNLNSKGDSLLVSREPMTCPEMLLPQQYEFALPMAQVWQRPTAVDVTPSDYAMEDFVKC